MEFKFTIQPYQTAAAEAVTSVFAGQPLAAPVSYVRDVGRRAVKTGRTTQDALATDDGAGYRNAGLRLSSAQLLANVRAQQARTGLPESDTLSHDVGAVQLDVEMETGTGKTYVYTKTMFELNRLYGWSKFIVVVPSVAIREGVAKSLSTTEHHFYEQYGKKIWWFVYNSGRLTDIDTFASSPDITCMVINMQAFNAFDEEKAKKEGKGGDKAARIMYSERDDFGSRRPIDVLKATHPIIILDEPQKMLGDKKKESATKKALRLFDPLFSLNYSATHKERHNRVYALDALDAYNQRLVKRIEVKGIEQRGLRGTDGYLYLSDIVLSAGKPPVAVIEHKKLGEAGGVRKVSRRFSVGDDIYIASQNSNGMGLEAYHDNYRIRAIEVAPDGRAGLVRFDNGLELHRGEIVNDASIDDLRRIQIRETIASHLEKEAGLFRRGIKCLSLFFIDEVAKYRGYGEGGEELVCGYGEMFEEEYAAAVAERLAHPTLDDEQDPSYLNYLRRFSAHEVHKGYFSIDKKTNRAIDSKESKKEGGISDDEGAYDLIMRNKERLLSFDEPCRFVFSHSALREGWDNPNIFQICTLKHSDNETGKRQEVGRGLRLCVDRDGTRQDLARLGEREVHTVNVLTVVASESYASFVDALQKDMRSELRERPPVVDNAYLASVACVSESGERVQLSAEEARRAYHFLVRFSYVDEDGRPTAKFREEGLVVEELRQLPDELRAKAPVIDKALRAVNDPAALAKMIGDGMQPKVTSNPLNQNFYRREFQQLWDRINHKYAYTVEFSDETLRANAVAAIDRDLRVSKVTYTVTRGHQREQAVRDELEMGEHFETMQAETREVGAASEGGIAYDLVGEIARVAAITRRSAADILGHIHPLKFAQFRDNPEEFITKVARIIVEQKGTLVVDHICYNRLDDTYDSGIFTESMPEAGGRAVACEKKCVQDWVFPDSAVERDLAGAMNSASEVVVYAKLPRGFAIPTPVGNYAPDWAIVLDGARVRHMFFVAETKGSLSDMNLRPVEQAKIKCARELFAELCGPDADGIDVRYDTVTSYEELLTEVMR